MKHDPRTQLVPVQHSTDPMPATDPPTVSDETKSLWAMLELELEHDT